MEMIVAKSKNNVIGKDNQLIWNLPEDLRYFKEVTMGKTVVMGRKTYESIGKPLPGRKNVVLTRNPSQLEGEDVICVTSVDEIFKLAETEKVIIIGGEKVYEEFFDHCDILYATEIEKVVQGDAFFPQIKKKQWELISSVKGLESTRENHYEFKIYAKV